MRIVVAHNRYASTQPSGENAVVADEVRDLREAGHDVIPLFRDSDEIAGMRPAQRLALAGSAVYSRRSTQELAELLRDQRPDLLHLHNPYPLVSPWVVRVAASQGVPVVQTVHNYRHGCVAGTLYRDGRICEDCLTHRLPWPAVAHGCYRGSRPQSLVMGVANVVHRPTWQQVSRFLVLTEFMASKLAVTGVPRERMTVRPTAVADPGEGMPGGQGLLFVGRLTEEKGVDLLLKAWRATTLGERHTLTLAGDGPLLDHCASQVGSTAGLRVLGRVDPAGISLLMRDCAVVAAPSLWYEGFPRVVVEAFAHGRPVVATRVGSLAEVVDGEVGWTAEPTVASLASTLETALDGPLEQRPGRARTRYQTRYRPDRVQEQLMNVYRQVTGG